MRVHMRKRSTILCVMSVLAALGVLLAGREIGDVNAQAGRTNTLDRDLEPVIIQGAGVPALIGEPTNRLYVYTFNGDTLNTVPIPAQVDEVAPGGYISFEDGVLDADDEIVFMAKDTGDQPSDTAPLLTLGINTTNWYEIEVVDPTTNNRGWAYLVRSTSFISPSGNYVEYSPQQITTTPHRYRLRFSSAHFGFDYLTLPNNSTADILDRTKLRVTVDGVTVNENNLGAPVPQEVIDGPVRVIVQRGADFFGLANLTATYLAYASMVQSFADVDIDSSVSVSSVRTSVDLNISATGAVFHNANVSGALINGIGPDGVAATPLSNWSQVSHPSGRLIQVANPEPAGGTQKNYYCDDTMSPVECDGTDKTGDGFSYGDVGILVDGGVNPTFVIPSTLFVLPPAAGSEPDNVGAAYKDYFFNPLHAMTFLMGERNTTFLPLVLKN